MYPIVQCVKTGANLPYIGIGQMLLARVLVFLVCIPAFGSVGDLRGLYDEMHAQAVNGDLGDVEIMTARVRNRVQNPSVHEMRSLVLEIYHQIQENPDATAAVKALQSAWLYQMVPTNERLIETIKEYLKHEIASVRWMALMHLREIYSGSAEWQRLTLDFLNRTEKRFQESYRSQPDRAWAEVQIWEATVSTLVRSELRLIAPLQSAVVQFYSGIGYGEILYSDPLLDLRKSPRNGDDPIVLDVLRLTLKEAQNVQKFCRKGKECDHPSGMQRARAAMANVVLDRGVEDSVILRDLRVLMDDPALPRFEDVELRDRFVKYYDGHRGPKPSCRIFLFPAQIPAALSATASGGSDAGIPESK